jgi:hypothetical protein
MKNLALLFRRACSLGGCILLAQAVLAQESVHGAFCEESGEVRIWISPLRPQTDGPVQFMAVSTDGTIDDLVVSDGEGRRVPVASTARGGPPWSLSATVARLGAGGYRAEAMRDGQAVACRQMDIRNKGGDRKIAPSGRADIRWNHATEALFSAWIEQLFDVPPEENLSFPSLEPVLRNPARNFLHNHLGLDEDKMISATPDCADFPYFLRAYFAWKWGLPFSFRACSRGTSRVPPRCGRPIVKAEFTRGAAPPSLFTKLTRELADTVHSGNARTALDDDDTDFYPLELRREALWPGTIYADPYGHVLVLARWVRQRGNRPGLLLAVDAQPDQTVSRKRFWEGTFLFAADLASAGAGFKAFRPVFQRFGDGGSARTLSNDELVDSPTFLPYSLDQEGLATEDFYARVGQLINPAGLGPEEAYEAALDALVEQLETRVTSVNNAEADWRKGAAGVIAMPAGAAIFETTGPWEDYSTPSRDMRLIIAMNVLTNFPEHIARHPELFVLQGRALSAVKADIEQHHGQRIQQRSIRYIRSDGSFWRLSVADVLARKPAFEMAYNPNDCPELRWGAREGTMEYATCKRHAPAAQRARMQHYRAWFRQARRPPR